MTHSVAIIGSGVAACSCAISLARHDLDVTLLKRQNLREGRLPVGEHLPPEGKGLLRALDLEDIMESPQHHETAGIVSYWGGQIGIKKNYLFNPLGHGLNLDRIKFNDALLRAVSDSGIHIIDYTRLRKISTKDSSYKISLTLDDRLIEHHTGFLIDATGRAAIAARQFGSNVFRHDKLVGLYGHVGNVACQDNRLIIETLEDGWWYSAPLTNDHVVAVFMTDTDLMPTGSAARQDFWRDRLEASIATSERLGRQTKPNIFQISDAATQTLSKPCGKNWIAVGDAAMAFDPISSAGMTKALSDGVQVAEAVTQHFGGSPFNSQSYEENCNRRFQDYKEISRSTYAKVTQFPNSKFWKRRQSN